MNDEHEGRRSREAVRNSVRSYGVKVMDPASLPLNKIQKTESQDSVGRYSEKSLHSQYEMREASCKTCLLRIPYGTLFGIFICALGLLLVAISFARILALEDMVYKDVLKRDPNPDLGRKIYSIVVSTMTAALTVMALIIGFLATGETRAEVHKTWKAKLGGKITCLVLLIVSFVLLITWILACIYTGWGLNIHRTGRDNCDAYFNSIEKSRCLPIAFETEKGRRELCDSQDIKKFCKDYTEKGLSSFAIFGCGSFLVTTALAIYICCLAANYTMIRLESKIQDLEELGPQRF